MSVNLAMRGMKVTESGIGDCYRWRLSLVERGTVLARVERRLPVGEDGARNSCTGSDWGPS